MDNVNVDKLVTDTLLSVGVPVERSYFSDQANEYITFQLIHRGDTNFTDDEEGAKEYHYGADIFTKFDFIALLDRVETAVKEAGFYDFIVNGETYEESTGFYHVSIEFKFIKLLEV